MAEVWSSFFDEMLNSAGAASASVLLEQKQKLEVGYAI